MPNLPSPCPWCWGTGTDPAAFALGQAVRVAGQLEVSVIWAVRHTHTDTPAHLITYLLSGLPDWVDEAALVAHEAYRVTCMTMPSRWRKTVVSTGYPTLEAALAAMQACQQQPWDSVRLTPVLPPGDVCPAPPPLHALQARYGALVDRHVLGELTPEEAGELLQLQDQLDAADAPSYAPVIARLRQALDALREGG